MASAAQDMQNDYDPWDAACVDLTDISAAPAPESSPCWRASSFSGFSLRHFSHLRRKKHHFSTAACFQFVLTRLDLT